MRESIVTRELEAKNIESATNKARKLEAYGKARTWYIMINIIEK